LPRWFIGLIGRGGGSALVLNSHGWLGLDQLPAGVPATARSRQSVLGV